MLPLCVSTSSGRVFEIFNVYGVVLGKGRYGGGDGQWVMGDLMGGLECHMSNVSG